MIEIFRKFDAIASDVLTRVRWRGVDGSLVAVGRFTRPTAFSPVRSVLIPKRFCVR